MRMWMVDPKIMCLHHLLGEHRELHALVGAVSKWDKMQASLEGLAKGGAIATSQLKARHDELVEELKRRNLPSGLNHGTPLEYVDTMNLGTVDPAASKQLLLGRCAKCCAMVEKLEGNNP